MYWGCAAGAEDEDRDCYSMVFVDPDDLVNHEAARDGRGIPRESSIIAAAGAAGSTSGAGPAEGVENSGGADAAGEQDAAGAKKPPPVPDGGFFPYIIVAAAWSPWSGNCPQQFNTLVASDGKGPKAKKGDQTGSGHLSGPGTLAESAASARTMVNDNGTPSSRRASEAAVKAEADRVRRDKRDKENADREEQLTALKREGVAAMKEANMNTHKLTLEMGRLASCREAETNLKRAAEERAREQAASDKRARKIGAVEKQLCLPFVEASHKARLQAMLSELLQEQLDE